jgi:hypothetical protein
LPSEGKGHTFESCRVRQFADKCERQRRFALDPDTRGPSIFGDIADVATWLHTYVQYANDLDQSRPDRAVVNNVGRPLQCWRQVVGTGMADVKTANPVQYLVAIPRRDTVRITRHLAHGHCDQRGIPARALGSPPRAAGGKNNVQGLLLPVLIGEISPSGSARACARFDRQRFEVALQIDVVDFSKIPYLKRVHSGLNLNAQRFELQRIFASPLLQRPERVANGFACILVFPRLDHALDEGILLWC